MILPETKVLEFYRSEYCSTYPLFGHYLTHVFRHSSGRGSQHPETDCRSYQNVLGKSDLAKTSDYVGISWDRDALPDAGWSDVARTGLRPETPPIYADGKWEREDHQCSERGEIL